MMAMRSAMVSASSWSWVTITVALERPVSTSLIWPRMVWRSSTSSRDSGSSNRKQLGSRTMARRDGDALLLALGDLARAGGRARRSRCEDARRPASTRRAISARAEALGMQREGEVLARR